ncbi:helix-turn-helix domain-containing protein [Chitinophaga nivalis]|uniref:Helix-turn-helix domain-containing protein n=1 Tax=Chitinophaga nivalis TaxID=2991709 RepID=A0ABT3ITV4_9BACT|nr:helix-turn-helix transcriptional regulator [Chitinophaga nivalis]MCW3463175.1 helix-turn-helix domain-containing protein [Chitinophaga nivalis]MCW3487135.1 helix-turn-helix domain-containing protein [Chitinophaga nivalis]
MNHNINRFLKPIRLQLYLSQTTISNMIGIPRITYHSYECGSRSANRPFLLERFLQLFGIDLHLSDQLHSIVFIDDTKLPAATVMALQALSFDDNDNDHEKSPASNV